MTRVYTFTAFVAMRHICQRAPFLPQFAQLCQIWSDKGTVWYQDACSDDRYRCVAFVATRHICHRASFFSKSHIKPSFDQSCDQAVTRGDLFDLTRPSVSGGVVVVVGVVIGIVVGVVVGVVIGVVVVIEVVVVVGVVAGVVVVVAAGIVVGVVLGVVVGVVVGVEVEVLSRLIQYDK